MRECGCWGYVDETPLAGVLTQEIPLDYVQMKRSQRLEDANTDANTQCGVVSLSSAGAIFYMPLGLHEADGINSCFPLCCFPLLSRSKSVIPAFSLVDIWVVLS